MEILTRNENETIAAAQNFSLTLNADECIFLQGNLGMGKSVFARGLIRSLTGNPGEEVPSPTFTLLQTYDTNKGPLWHFDLYRLKTPEEIYELGWEDALSSGIILAEWPERLGPLKPRKHTHISFENISGNEEARLIRIQKFS